MLPPKMTAPWELYAGDESSIAPLFTTDGTTPEVLPLTGWQATWRSYAGSTDSVAIAVDATNAASGILVLSLTGAQTAAMTAAGVFDVQNGDRTYLRGETAWSLDVTR